MIDDKNIGETLRRLEELMYGYNYDVAFGVDIFDNCPTIDEFKKQLYEKYDNLKPENFQPVFFDEAEFWEELNFGLTYRGDEGAGLKLTLEKEEKLLSEQETFKTFIKQFISTKTKIHSFPEELGVAFVSIFWGFTFLLLNEDRPSVLINASASD
jgi:hypothetical protein